MRIGDLCSYAPKSQIKAGEAVDGAEYMFFTSSVDENKRYTDYLLDGEWIIMGTGGNATLHYYSGRFATSTDCVVLQPDDSVRCKYLYYFFKANMVILEAGFKGAGLKHTNKKYIDDICINSIPNLSRQDEVILVLDKLQGMINSRKAELLLLDDLIKARFVEMFGEPIANPMGWKMVTIGDIVLDVRYGTSKPAVEGGRYPYLRMNNLTFDGHLDLTDLKYIDIEDDEIEKCVVRKGDVLFNRTNSVELVGKTATFDLDEEMVIAGYIIRVRLGNRMLPEVLSQYMNLEALKNILRDMAKGAVNQANINAQELKSIRVYVPDMDIQRRFLDFKVRIDKSKFINVNLKRCA